MNTWLPNVYPMRFKIPLFVLVSNYMYFSSHNHLTFITAIAVVFPIPECTSLTYDYTSTHIRVTREQSIFQDLRKIPKASKIFPGSEPVTSENSILRTWIPRHDVVSHLFICDLISVLKPKNNDTYQQNILFSMMINSAEFSLFISGR